DQLVPGVTQALAGPAVHVQDAALLVVQEERVGGMVHERPKPLLAGPQRLLGPLAVGDVHATAQEADRLASGVAHGHAPGEKPAVGTVLVAGPVLDFELAALPGQVAAHGRFDVGAVVRVYQ